MTSVSTTISGTKVMLKYGGPTDMRPSSSAEISSGYRVPISTVAIAITSTMLLPSSAVSRDHNPISPFAETAGARNA